MTATYALDAWAILAYLKRETPADLRVRELLEGAAQGTLRLLVSVINLGEVFYAVGREKGEPAAEAILAELRLLPIEILPVDDGAVMAAARWNMRHAISYADAFAAATARDNGAILVTGDPELVALKGRLKIERLPRQ